MGQGGVKCFQTEKPGDQFEPSLTGAQVLQTANQLISSCCLTQVADHWETAA